MKLLLVLLLFARVAIGAQIAHLAAPVANTLMRDAESNRLEVAFVLLVHGMLAVAFFSF